jgi:hypothetical protein
MAHRSGQNRRQFGLFATLLDEMITPDSLCRALHTKSAVGNFRCGMALEGGSQRGGRRAGVRDRGFFHNLRSHQLLRMTEQTTHIDVGQSKILNLDADDQGNFIAFTDNKSVITNDHKLKIEIDIRFPVIRRLDSETFFIADSRTQKGNNGYIFNFNGQLVKSFLAGDGIEDIIVHRGKIVITYFDEGVYRSDGPSGDGLAVFDFLGQQEFGVNSGAGNMVIADCYCICKHGTNRVLFYAYTDLKVFELNLDTFKIESFETPNDFSGASAISSTVDKIILHSSYHDKRSFFSWDRNKKEVIKFGDYSPGLTGIKNGKFLIYGDNGYTIINPTE